MNKKDYTKLGDECFDHLKEINPTGGVKGFVRIAVEFGYKRAVENLNLDFVTQRSELVCGLGRHFLECEKHHRRTHGCKRCPDYKQTSG